MLETVLELELELELALGIYVHQQLPALMQRLPWQLQSMPSYALLACCKSRQPTLPCLALFGGRRSAIGGRWQIRRHQAV